MRGWLAALLVAAACGSGAAHTAPAIENPVEPAAEPIVIGHVASLSGPMASFGLAADRGARLAIAQHLGAPVRLVTVDDAGQHGEAAAAVTRLIDDDGAVAILGEVASSLTMAAGAVAQERGVPLISPAATNPEVTRIGDMVFRVAAVDADHARAAAIFAREHLRAARAAILVDGAHAYSRELAGQFARHFEAAGGVVAVEQTYAAGSFDAAALAATPVDVVYLPGYYTDVMSILPAARAAGIAAPLVGADGWDSPELGAGLGAALDGSFYSHQFSIHDEQAAAFVDAFRAEHGEAPDAIAALGYDAARLLLDALDRAAGAGGADLAAAIASTRGFAGVTGTISFDAERNPRKPLLILGYQRGAETLVARIAPAQ
jgi:branched-chain amino acid transport system substrate-binding protein